MALNQPLLLSEVITIMEISVGKVGGREFIWCNELDG